MNDTPNSISFKELSKFLSKATSEIHLSEDNCESLTKVWINNLNELIVDIEKYSESETEGKSKKQIMAFGSFKTLLKLSLQTLRASDLE